MARKSRLKKSDPLDSMESSNGKLEGLDELRSLESIFGTKKTNIFGTTDIRIFDQDLASMTIVDLQNMAEKAGINKFLPVPELKASLRRSFERNAGTHSGALKIPARPPMTKLDKNDPKHLDFMKMMGMKTV